METDVAKMSNQERVAVFGIEEASKYHGPYERREPLMIYHSLTPEGGAWHNRREALKRMGQPKEGKIPREYIVPAPSFKRNRPEKQEKPLTFDKKKVKCTKRSKNRHVQSI